MKNAQTDRFHQLFSDHGEPRLPISVYNKLLDAMDADTAFDLLCNYEKGLITLYEVTSALPSD